MPRLVQTVPVSNLITEMGDRRQQQTCQDSRLLGFLFLRTEFAKFQPISKLRQFLQTRAVAIGLGESPNYGTLSPNSVRVWRYSKLRLIISKL